MKIYLDFEPCKECKEMIKELALHPEEPAESSRKFLRHITYNHDEVVQAIIKDVPKALKKEDLPWYR